MADEKHKAIVVVHRDPDSSNEHVTFADAGVYVEVFDIDYGRSDLRNAAEFNEWRESHLEQASELAKGGRLVDLRAAAHIIDAVAQAAENYGHA